MGERKGGQIHPTANAVSGAAGGGGGVCGLSGGVQLLLDDPVDLIEVIEGEANPKLLHVTAHISIRYTAESAQPRG
eukprot:COSAG01_NODE_2747_length_7149_cov_5.321844_4_plen_76_part_00